MTDEDRDRLRKLQDRWLALPHVRRFIAENGEEKLLQGYYATEGPNLRDVRVSVLPGYERYFRDQLEEYGDGAR